MVTRRRKARAKAAGERQLALSVALVAACESTGAPSPELEPEPVDVHADARERLAAFEQASRDAADFATIPASDGRFGADPYRLIALPDGRFAGILRGADKLVLLDASGRAVDEVETVHDPTDLAWRDGELLVVGSGEPVVARHTLAERLGTRVDRSLPAAFAPRSIAVGPDRELVVADEAGRLHIVGDAGTQVVDRYCRGPVELELDGDRLLAACVLDHRVRIDRLTAAGIEPLAAITHDGPIWSLALGPTHAGERLLALTGVEDHPLDRSDGGFGYVDSFVFLYTLAADGGPTRRAAINTSELGVVTPKWSRWQPGAEPTLLLAGYATADLLELGFATDLSQAPSVARRVGVPGTSSAVALAGGELLAANPLFDAWLRYRPGEPARLERVPDVRDDRSFEERLGEVLLFTTAMAPANVATDARSRFSCETCHFEGRGDGRTHYTGRERDGVRVHATSKPLLGLFPNRPYFSRALDRSMAQMVDNEFRVANRHSGRDPWATLHEAELAWLDAIEGWPGEVDGELQRRAVMAFLQRYSTPSNPAVRGRDRFTELEESGARAFEAYCEDCHQARLVADEPSTRVPYVDWERLIFADNAPIVWASADYQATEIEPYVHERGARVPSLRRLVFKYPYFTNGSDLDLDGLLAHVRRTADGVTHGASPIPLEQQLAADDRAALAAFVRLL